MKIITMLCLFLLAMPTIAATRDEDVVHEFVKQTYQRRMAQNYALAAITQVPSKVESEISIKSESDQELFDAIVGSVERKVEKIAGSINKKAFNALNYDEEFLKVAAEAVLDKFSVDEMREFLENGISDDSLWMEKQAWENAVAAASQTTNMSIAVMESTVEELVKQTIADLPSDREEQLVVLRSDINPLRQAVEAWQQLSYGLVAYVNDNPNALKDESGKVLPKCWAPDNKLRDQLSRIKLFNVSFQCFRVGKDDETSYGYFPLVLVEHCLSEANSSDCKQLFSDLQLSQLRQQIIQYNRPE